MTSCSSPAIRLRSSARHDEQRPGARARAQPRIPDRVGDPGQGQEARDRAARHWVGIRLQGRSGFSGVLVEVAGFGGHVRAAGFSVICRFPQRSDRTGLRRADRELPVSRSVGTQRRDDRVAEPALCGVVVEAGVPGYRVAHRADRARSWDHGGDSRRGVLDREVAR